MSTGSRVVGSGLSASSLARNPSARPRDPVQIQGLKQSLEDTPQAASRAGQEQKLMGAYTLITPNESRRSRMQRIAKQELESLEKWKEQHRAKPVSLVPKRLGGSQSEAEVRQKQQLQLMQSKYQQKLKREQSMRLKKEAEEAEIQKMKAIQREKSNKLEEKKRLQETLRREAFFEHRSRKTAEFLSRLDAEFQNKNTCQNTFHDPQSSAWKLPVLSGDQSWSKSWAYKESVKAKENQKLQKMKEEQQQKSDYWNLSDSNKKKKELELTNLNRGG